MEQWYKGGQRTRLDLLGSHGFLFALSLLLLNDFFLKRYAHGTLSGKLSDFAGLFVLPIFCVAFFPRLKTVIYVLVAALFIVWKSSWSEPLIEIWNSFSPFAVARTVDYTDLWALLILPWSFRSSERRTLLPKDRRWLYAIGIISIFAFAATSYRSTTPYSDQYSFPVSRRELLERMSHLPTQKVWHTFWDADDFQVGFKDCISAARISISEIDQHAVITLKEITFRCPRRPGKEIMQAFFEKEFVDKLREPVATDPLQIRDIWGIPKEPSPEASPSPPILKRRSVERKK
jgi:hypothetical protein